ncbi:phosphate acyltransferase [Rubrivirga sp. SAORIC476]|uniref:phosphate acyltransferase PlsX n=1 Tax=Rubrivirga sp. SAORIC476 TaxID=1961794 RepID=UPI000BA93DC4|nr:phosphate acyltransferase PlsX [Rubrivirga sp. SAORIC476]PAP81240.1 phosphate acyltransferase [Rubrivirga sp. SAORIC476]
MPVRVAVDAMGGDYAPGVVVEGVLDALAEAGDRVTVLLVGREAEVRAELDRLGGAENETLRVVDAPQAIGMGESPTVALKTKPESSIHIGIGAVKNGRADAFASAGNTGAVMTAALFGLGRLPGVLRPALPGYLPTPSGTCVVLDVGANVEVRPEHLVQFAQMGAVFGAAFLGKEDPTVGLINVGEEPGKGTDTVKEAHKTLAALGEQGTIRFVGNVEGRDILQHGADVCVCDGFVGNVVLKLAESVATILPQMVRSEIGRQELAPEQAQLVGGVLKGMLAPFDYQAFGGVPMLGIDGTVVIGHGGSSARAIRQMVLSTASLVEQNLTARIGRALRDPGPDASSS